MMRVIHSVALAYRIERALNADDQPVDPEGAREGPDANEGARPHAVSAASGSLHASEDDDAEEAELGSPEDRPRATDERPRGHGVHPRRGTQPRRTLHRAHPRWSREGCAGR